MAKLGLPYGSPLYYGKVRGICRGFFVCLSLVIKRALFASQKI